MKNKLEEPQLGWVDIEGELRHIVIAGGKLYVDGAPMALPPADNGAHIKPRGGPRRKIRRQSHGRRLVEVGRHCAECGRLKEDE